MKIHHWRFALESKKLLLFILVFSFLSLSLNSQNLLKAEDLIKIFYDLKETNWESANSRLREFHFSKEKVNDYISSDGQRINFALSEKGPTLIYMTPNNVQYNNVWEEILVEGEFVSRVEGKEYWKYKNFVVANDESIPINVVFFLEQGPPKIESFLEYFVNEYPEDDIREIIIKFQNLEEDSLRNLLNYTPFKLTVWRLANQFQGVNYVDQETYDYHAVIGYLAYVQLKNRNKLTSDDYYHGGWLKQQLREYKNAIRDFTKALELGFSPDGHGTKELALGGRAECKFGIDDYYGAINDFSAALELDKGYTWHLGRGKAYLSLDLIEKSIADFSSAISLDPKIDKAYLYRGIARLDKDKVKACLDFSNAGELGSNKAYDLIKEHCSR